MCAAMRSRRSSTCTRGRALEFDQIALRIEQVLRRPLVHRSVARTELTDRCTLRLQVRDDRLLIARRYLQAQVIYVAALRSRRRPAHTAELAIPVDQVDQRIARGNCNRPMPCYYFSAVQPGTSR